MDQTENLLVTLNSVKRAKGTSCQAEFNLRNTQDRVRGASLKSFVCPHLFGNVPVGSSIQYQLVTAGTGVVDLAAAKNVIPVPAGRYTSTELVAAINASITTEIGLGNIVGHVPVFTLTTTGGLDYITWVSGVPQDLLIIDHAVDRRFSLVDQLGIDQADVQARGGALVASQSVLLSGPSAINITCTNIAKGRSVNERGDRTHILASVPVTVGFSQIIHYTADDVTHNLVTHSQSFQLSESFVVELTDSQGRPLTFVNSAIENGVVHGWGCDILMAHHRGM